MKFIVSFGLLNSVEIKAKYLILFSGLNISFVMGIDVVNDN